MFWTNTSGWKSYTLTGVLVSLRDACLVFWACVGSLNGDANGSLVFHGILMSRLEFWMLLAQREVDVEARTAASCDFLIEFIGS